MATAEPSPFQVSISQDEREDLRSRLRRTRWPDELSGVGWEYGSSLSYIKELAEYWQQDFKWQKAEDLINSYKNYKLLVNSINVHFIHERSPAPDAIPLIFIHGWPGSIIESFKIIRLLTHPGNSGRPAFHVVVPSLPGYGFSSAPSEPGFGVKKTADTFHQLMISLGYSQYIAQGGDIGSAVSSVLAADHGESCRAVHLNFVPLPFNFGSIRLTNPRHVLMYLNAKLPILKSYPLAISKEELGFLERNEWFGTKESGLLAYIVEKFRTWSDCHGDVESMFSKDELLANVSIYWFNANITSSFRMYYESLGPFSADLKTMSSKRVTVPVAVANFDKEIIKSPRVWAESSLNIKQWSVFNEGGHFAALEKPDLLVEDMAKFFAEHH